ncbi:MAG: ribonuclease P protein component [Butyribacter sp.]|nr:ribonuclease P protein component [bacterium]MDY3854661.1 ribonuclease P protein component [Butyribacter sp.]
MMVVDSIKKNRDFVKVYRQGKSYANKYLVMYVLKNNSEKNRYGISVSKKVGNSVVRHRVTRLIRESIRLNLEQFEKGFDIVLIARNTAKGKSYYEIESAVLHLAKMHHIIKR